MCTSVKNFGKTSCCAPGGAWFKNCGDAGDTKFDHTWAEGIQACKGAADSVPVLSQRRVATHHSGVIAYPLGTAQLDGPTPQDLRDMEPLSVISNGGIEDSIDCGRCARADLYLCSLFIVIHSQI